MCGAQCSTYAVRIAAHAWCASEAALAQQGAHAAGRQVAAARLPHRLTGLHDLMMSAFGGCAPPHPHPTRRHDLMMSAFGGCGLRAATLPELHAALARAVASALHDRVPALVDVILDPQVGAGPALRSHGFCRVPHRSTTSLGMKESFGWAKARATRFGWSGSRLSRDRPALPTLRARLGSANMAAAMLNLEQTHVICSGSGRLKPLGVATSAHDGMSLCSIKSTYLSSLAPQAGVESGNVHSFNAPPPKAKL